MKTQKELQRMLYEEVAEGTQKGWQFIKKYNLTPYCLEELFFILAGRQNTTIVEEVYKILKDYGYNIKIEGIGWRIL